MPKDWFDDLPHTHVVEHVHPNQRGYVLLARFYFDALRKANFLGRAADLARLASWEDYTRRMNLTDLDQRIAYHTIKTVTTRWPFVPVSKNEDYRGTYKPVNLLDSIAFNESRGGMPWAQAKVMLAAYYIAHGQVDSAVAEYDGLIRDEPGIETAYRLAGRALFDAKQPERARVYLEKANAIQPSSSTAYTLGVIAMQSKDYPRAITMLEQSVQLSPDPSTIYQLSLVYALNHDIARARANALRLLRIAPNFPGLGQWMATIGMTGN